MIVEIFNWIACVMAVLGSLTLACKADNMRGWIIYTIAAVAGIIYFSMTGNWPQLGVWCMFLFNDILAMRRKLRTSKDDDAPRVMWKKY